MLRIFRSRKTKRRRTPTPPGQTTRRRDPTGGTLEELVPEQNRQKFSPALTTQGMSSSGATAMIRMICRNKLADFTKWKSVFDSHAGAHRKAGLSLESLWRGIENPNEV